MSCELDFSLSTHTLFGRFCKLFYPFNLGVLVSEKQDQQDNSAPQQAGAQSAQGSELQKQIEELKAQVEKYKNDYLYLRADFDNFRKNSIKERSDYLKYGSERLIIEILNVLDNFERAIETKATPETLQTYMKGVEMTAAELKSVLKNFGVIDVASHGAPFDPNVHEALGSEPTADIPVGHIVRVFKKPYKLHDKLIRPGQVVVASKPGSNA